MRPLKPRTQPWHSSLKSFTFRLFALIVVGLGIVGSLSALGVIDLSFLAKKTVGTPFKPTPAGIPVFLTARAVPAYTKVSRDDLLDPKTGNLAIVYLLPEQVQKEGYITDMEQVLNRVLNRPKAVGYAFTEKDFCPEGTRPGLVGGIPPGKRAYVLEVQADKVRGMQALKEGDRFDLLGTLDFEKAFARRGSSGVSGTLLTAQTAGSNLPKPVSVKALVQNGVVVVPLTAREVPLASGTQGKDGKTQTRTVQEITIAIDPEEVAPLTEAVGVEAGIICVPRSGRPDDPGLASKTPGSKPPPKIHTVEIIVGSKRQVLVFPPPDEGPPEPAETYSPGAVTSIAESAIPK